ncbi:MAG: serine/threonine-protein kinase [Myxococcota bacterium]
MLPKGAPSTLGEYSLKELLGRGGMAEVYLAERDGPAGFKKKLVVKRILPIFAEDPNFVQLFLREARVAASLNHPNVVQVHELAHQGDEYFIAMEFIDGLTLSRLARRAWALKQSLPMEVAVRSIAEAALGLNHAHELVGDDGKPRPLIHRDVSPDNLMLNRDGITKVLDFGVAKDLASGGLTQAGQLRGKAHFMAPEYLEERPVDGRADLYGLGCCLYWMLTGRRPFEGNEVAVVRAIVEDTPPKPVEINALIPARLSDLVVRMLQKDPDARIQTGAELHDELADAMPWRPNTSKEFLKQLLGAPDLERTMANISVEGFPAARPVTNPAVSAPVKDLEDAPLRPTVVTSTRRVDDEDAARVAALPTQGNAVRALVWGGATAIVLLGAGTAFMLRPREVTQKPAAVAVAPTPPALAPPPPTAPAATPAPAPAPAVVPTEESAEKPEEAGAPDEAEPSRKSARRVKNRGTDGEPEVKPVRGVPLEVTAPAHIVWEDASGRALGKGSGTLRVPATDKYVYAIDPVRSGKTRVATTHGAISYDSLAKGTLTVKFAPGVKVFLGTQEIRQSGVPVSLVGGTYRLKMVLDGQEQTQSVDISGYGKKEITIGVTDG